MFEKPCCKITRVVGSLNLWSFWPLLLFSGCFGVMVKLHWRQRLWCWKRHTNMLEIFACLRRSMAKSFSCISVLVAQQKFSGCGAVPAYAKIIAISLAAKTRAHCLRRGYKHLRKLWWDNVCPSTRVSQLLSQSFKVAVIIFTSTGFFYDIFELDATRRKNTVVLQAVRQFNGVRRSYSLWPLQWMSIQITEKNCFSKFFLRHLKSYSVFGSKTPQSVPPLPFLSCRWSTRAEVVHTRITKSSRNDHVITHLFLEIEESSRVRAVFVLHCISHQPRAASGKVLQAGNTRFK